MSRQKKSVSQGGLQAASANDRNIHVYKFVSLPVSDLSPCGLCQIEEVSHLSEALMPPASLSWCVVLECGIYILRNHIGKNKFFSSLSHRKLPIRAHNEF